MGNSIIYFDGYKPALEVSQLLDAHGGVLQIEVVESDRENKLVIGENKFLAYALFYHEARPDGYIFDVIGNRSTTMRTAMTADAIMKFYHKILPRKGAIDLPFLHESNLVYPRFHAKHVRPTARETAVEPLRPTE